MVESTTAKGLYSSTAWFFCWRRGEAHFCHLRLSSRATPSLSGTSPGKTGGEPVAIVRSELDCQARLIGEGCCKIIGTAGRLSSTGRGETFFISPQPWREITSFLEPSGGIGVDVFWGRSNKWVDTYTARCSAKLICGIGPDHSVRPTPKRSRTYPNKLRLTATMTNVISSFPSSDTDS